jgi:hypothetical protein
MKAGPKAAVDESSLPFRPRTKGAPPGSGVLTPWRTPRPTPNRKPDDAAERVGCSADRREIDEQQVKESPRAEDD